MKKEIDYFREVHKESRLWEAWKKVYQNGSQSRSQETRLEIREFQKRELTSIRTISKQLRECRYKFKPARGIPVRRKGKTSRPIVVHQIQDRIVLRSILDVLQGNSSILEILKTKTSFGGIEGQSVRKAVEAAHWAITHGCKYYIRTDIEGFFTRIPRQKVIDQIVNRIPDIKFIGLLERAVITELENLASLGKESNLFPIFEIGVAQGCCLSPLIGNILLREFDAEMNRRGIVCLRYIDDFLILGRKPSNVKRAFTVALKLLEGHGMVAYDPWARYDKAEFGETAKGIQFLGCNISPDRIRPSWKSWRRLLEKLQGLADDSLKMMTNPNRAYFEHKSLASTLYEMDNIIKGWGNQYAYCNDLRLMNNLDDQISEIIRKYIRRYGVMRARLKKKSDFRENLRRILGIHLLTDSKSDPIIISQ